MHGSLVCSMQPAYPTFLGMQAARRGRMLVRRPQHLVARRIQQRLRLRILHKPNQAKPPERSPGRTTGACITRTHLHGGPQRLARGPRGVPMGRCKAAAANARYLGLVVAP
jgi:hypothetical protein